jgi:Flp pilus assembly secretin CpaC
VTVALWQHILVVLALLASNATTFIICKRRIETLRAALLAKKVLLADHDPETIVMQALKQQSPMKQPLFGGETLSVKGDNYQIDIKASNAVTLEVRAVEIA